jgi:hypothetical protein
MSWKPNYTDVMIARQERIELIRSDRNLRRAAIEYYRTRPVEFIEHWLNTYDPRNAGSDVPTHMPFILFDRQKDFVNYVYELVKAQRADGLAEKAREMGFTWIACAISVPKWLFQDGSAIGWGSRKEDLVDKIGDPKSVFDKLRTLIHRMPREFWPKGFDPKRHTSFMRIINPENGASITGEAGDNIGRGGRTTIYFVDEAAHLEHPDLVEAALSENTRVRVDISSVNGTGNVFHRRREAGIEWAPGMEIQRGQVYVFIADWRDDPRKSQEWYDTRKAKFEREGLGHIFAQEVDRRYEASQEGVIIHPDWVQAAEDAHVKLGWPEDGMWSAGFDVADGGLDVNAYVACKGNIVRRAREWGGRDTGQSTQHVVAESRELAPLDVQFDVCGVGSGVKSEANRLRREKLMPKGVNLVAWNAGAKVQNGSSRMIPGEISSPTNADYYFNLKAQAWWSLRAKFWKTYQAVTQGAKYPVEEMISISSEIPVAVRRKLMRELSQATRDYSGQNLKMVVDKTPEGTKSPNLADAMVMCCFPQRAGAEGFLDLMEELSKETDQKQIEPNRPPPVPDKPPRTQAEEGAADEKQKSSTASDWMDEEDLEDDWADED